MQSYISNTSEEQQAMLEAIGAMDSSELFEAVPIEALMDHPMKLGPGMSEIDLMRVFQIFMPDAARPLFRGAGFYRHFIPNVVEELSRGGLYAPQEETQGVLQAIFEYQTLICALTGMQVSNASVSDGVTACIEALRLMRENTGRNKLLLSSGLHPAWRAVIDTYAKTEQWELVTVPLDEKGQTDLAFVKENAADCAGALIANPNFYGCIEDLQAFADILHENQALLAAVVNPISLGVLKRPGDVGADIALGEGQPLGLSLFMGGARLGFMASTAILAELLPGRIIGKTADLQGNARFAPVERPKGANVCVGESRNQTTAAMYLAALGAQGLKDAAQICLYRAHYLCEGIQSIRGMRQRYPMTPFFHEFVIDGAKDPQQMNRKLLEKGFVGGLALGRYIPNDNGVLYCVTEMNARDEMDRFLNALEVSAK